MKFRYITNLSAVILGTCLLMGSKADADSLEVINKTPFTFSGAIVRFFDVRDYFTISGAIAGETITTHPFESAFFSPSVLLASADRSRELCYFSDMNGDSELIITYNNCNSSHPHCLLHCVVRTTDPTDADISEDTIEVSYSLLAS